MVKANSIIKLEGAENLRDLGGYPTTDGKKTKTGVFFRGDGTDRLSGKDVATLKKLGLTTVVDLRSEHETFEKRSVFINDREIAYKNVVMFDSAALFRNNGTMPNTLGELYVRLLDFSQEQILQVFEVFLYADGATLFHCMAGKDRTGVVAMLLLQLAGVNDETIVNDYIASEINLVKLMVETRKMVFDDGSKIPQNVIGSKREDISVALNHLYNKYGDAEKYFVKCGFDAEHIATIKTKFVE